MSLATLAATRVFRAVELANGHIFTCDVNKALMVSTDDGANFSAVPGTSGITVSFDSMMAGASGELVFGSLATPPKIYYATATGVTQATGTLTNAATGINRISADVAGSMWACTDFDGNIYHSTDHGHSWTSKAVSYPGGSIGHVYALCETTYGLAIAGEIGSANISTDGGTTWTDWGLVHPSPSGNSDYHGNLWNIQQHPTTGSLYATIGDPFPPNPSAGTCQVHRNADATGVWHGVTGMSNAGSNNISSFVFQADGSVLMASIYSVGPTGQVYKTTNDGASWTEVSTSMFGHTFVGTPRLTLGPSGRIYIGDNAGLYRLSAPASSAPTANAMFFGGGV